MRRARKTTAVSVLAILACVLPVALPANAQVTSADQLTYPPLGSFEFPKPHRERLPNGMVILLLEDHELPLIKATALIRTGSRLEPADEVGLAGLTGQVMRTGGTTKMTGDELDDFLESRAAIIETSINQTAGVATLDVLKQDFDAVLPIFSDILRHPVFNDDKIKVAKTGLIAGISRQNDSPTSILNREFPELIYGSDSPYARRPTYASVNKITRNDLVDWHHRYFQPNRVILGVVGDFDSRTMFEKLWKVFGPWPRGPAIRPGEADVLYERAAHPGVYFAPKEDVTQSNIRIGHLGIEKSNPDYYAVEVLNEVLSGSFASRLFADVRTKKGLAYAVRGGVGSRWDHPGLFSMFMSTKTKTTGEGIGALLDEARDLTARPPTDEEVKRAKQSILNSFVFNADSAEKVLRQQLTFEYYGYPLDWLQRYRRGIDAVTVGEVRKAAAAYVHPDDFAILVVGPKDVETQLKPFGEPKELDISIPEPKAPEVEMTAAGAEKATALLDKAVAAMGGADRLAGIANTAIEGTTTVRTPQGGIDVKSSVLVVYPDKLRQEATLPFGKLVTVVSPDAAFVITPRGTQPLPESQKQEAMKEIIHDPVTLLRARGKQGFEAAVTGQDEVAGKAVDLVTVKYSGETDTLAIDPESGRILAERYRGKGPGGIPGQIEKLFSDFRTVDGLEFPFATSSTLNGDAVSSSKIDSLSINVEVPADAFTPPAESSDDKQKQ